MKTESVGDLETSVLIRLWFRLLWQTYDLGGISVGRSLRCDLLDCYLDFTPMPSFVSDADCYNEGLEQEILRRGAVPPQGLIAPERIPRYSKEDIALAGLGALLALEFSVDADVAWRDGYELERKRIKAVLERFPFIEVPPELDIKEVSAALLQRKREIEWVEGFLEFQKPIPDCVA